MGRLWFSRTSLTPEFIKDGLLEDGILASRPEATGPSEILRIRVLPSSNGTVNIAAVGRELPGLCDTCGAVASNAARDEVRSAHGSGLSAPANGTLRPDRRQHTRHCRPL